MNVKVDRCEVCGKVLSPFVVVLTKYPVCRKCVDKRHKEVVGR